jgi:hypothetical protein
MGRMEFYAYVGQLAREQQGPEDDPGSWQESSDTQAWREAAHKKRRQMQGRE